MESEINNIVTKKKSDPDRNAISGMASPMLSTNMTGTRHCVW